MSHHLCHGIEERTEDETDYMVDSKSESGPASERQPLIPSVMVTIVKKRHPSLAGRESRAERADRPTDRKTNLTENQRK